MTEYRYALVVHPDDVEEARVESAGRYPVLLGEPACCPPGSRMLVREDVLPPDVRAMAFPDRLDWWDLGRTAGGASLFWAPLESR